MYVDLVTIHHAPAADRAVSGNVPAADIRQFERGVERPRTPSYHTPAADRAVSGDVPAAQIEPGVERPRTPLYQTEAASAMPRQPIEVRPSASYTVEVHTLTRLNIV
jgi:DNA-binding transcriptional regulator YdaS (Cro superfamily)